MQSEVEVITEVATTRIGDVRVDEVTVYTSDGDLVANYFNVLVDGDIKHSNLSAKAAIRALGHYMGGL